MKNRSHIKSVIYTLARALPIKARVAIHFYRRHGRWPNIDNPQTLNEKMAWRKIHERNQTFVDWACKWKVKSIVSTKIGAQYVIPTLWAGEDIREAPLESLPVPYVIKTSNGSGENYFVKKSEDMNRTLINKLFGSIGVSRLALATDEWFYNSRNPKILVEKMLVDEGGNIPWDYKFHVFGGKVEFLCVHRIYNGARIKTYFLPSWEVVEMKWGTPLQECSYFPPPENLAEMIEIASLLGGRFDYVRIDLYDHGGRIYFGEATFAPLGGIHRMEPHSYDYMWGKKWILPD